MSSSNRRTGPPARATSRRPLFGLAVVLVLSVLGARQAHAPPTVFPGSQCQPAKPDVSKVSYVNTLVQNDSGTASAKVICPLALYFGSITSEHDELWIIVQPVDRNPTANVSCTALATATDTGQVFWNGGSRSTTGTGDIGDLRWAIPIVLGQSILGAYAVVCTLPPAPASSQRSAVRSITVSPVIISAASG